MMFMKNKYLFKMTMYPMVIFVLLITVLKVGSMLPVLTENSAQASMNVPNYKDEYSLGLFSAIKDWRQSKIIRSSLGYNPEVFYELSAHDIRKLFGTPSLNRQDGQARMIQYTHNNCVADFYYLSGDVQKISHYEIRQLENNQASDCLIEILNNL